MLKKKLSKVVFISVYALIIMGMFLFARIEQNIDYKKDGSPIYKDLRNTPAYIKRGFSPKEAEKTANEFFREINSGEWATFESTGRRIKNSTLDLPRRIFLSPFRNETEVFTMVIPIEISSDALTWLQQSESILPGIYLPGIGENWEIYFNGKLILSEFRYDNKGRTKNDRVWRDVHFPLNKSLLIPGINLLVFHIAGDPNYQATGLYYSAAPIYLENYWTIVKRINNDHIQILFGVFAIIGLYYLMLFFFIRKKGEVYNLYYGLFSIMLSIFTFARNSWSNLVIPNSQIASRLELIFLPLMVLALCFFIETLGRKRITKVTWVYAIFCFFITITQIFFCVQYGQEIIMVWNVSFLFYFLYVLYYDVFYFIFWDKNGLKGKTRDRLADLPLVHILTAGSLLIYISALYDILIALFFNRTTYTFLYGTFVMQIAMAFSLTLRFSGIYKRMEKSNIILEIAVQERTQELEKQTEIAIKASKEKSQFLATMSHEIRTPLNAVICLSEIVLQRNKLLPESKNDLNQIHQSGSTLLGIINDILDISKIEAGGLELIPSEYNTAQLINDTVNLNRVRIGSKPIEFVLYINNDFPARLVGDELRIKQILNNILSNAVKYTKQGKVVFGISWEKTVQENDSNQKALLTFKVSDTGIGIRQEDIGRLFSDYIQLDSGSNRRIEGTGLGLVISRKLLDMMHGTINVESEFGKGSVFTVTLEQVLPDLEPIGKVIADSLKSFRYISKDTDKKIDYSWMPYGKVLVVDDLPVNLIVLKELLEPYGVKVDTVLSGNEAITKLQSAIPQYDIVFMDHMMPILDGVETTSKIRLWEKEVKAGNMPVPIIALTANALAGNMEMYLSRGFNGYITKPIDAVKLDRELNLWIRDKQTPGTLEEAEAEKRRLTLARFEAELNDKTTTRFAHAYDNQILLPDIAGLDVKRGIEITGGKVKAYFEILLSFCEDSENRLPLLHTALRENNLKNFTILVHALKSASASIAASWISNRAAGFEAAGKEGNTEYIENQLPVFTKELTELIENIRNGVQRRTTGPISND